MPDQVLPGGWTMRGGVLIPPDPNGALPPSGGPPAPQGEIQFGPQGTQVRNYTPQGPPAPPKMQLSDPVAPPKDVTPADQQDAFEEMQRLMSLDVTPRSAPGDSPAPQSEPPDDTQGRIAGLEKIRGQLGLARALGQGGNAIARGFMTLGRVPQNVTTGNDLSGIDQAEGQLTQDLARNRGQLPQGLRKTLGIGDTAFPGGLTYEQFSKISPTLVGEANRKAADTRLRDTQLDREDKEVRQTLAKAYSEFDTRNSKLRQEVQDTEKAQKLLSGPDVGPQALQLAARSIIRAVESGRLTDRDVDAVAKLPGIYERLKTFVQTGIGGDVNPDVVAGLKKLALDQGQTVRNLYEREKEDAALRVKNELRAAGNLHVPDGVIMTQFGIK